MKLHLLALGGLALTSLTHSAFADGDVCGPTLVSKMCTCTAASAPPLPYDNYYVTLVTLNSAGFVNRGYLDLYPDEDSCRAAIPTTAICK
jgi:hypothetical protein